RVTSRIPAKAAGRSRTPSTKPCRCPRSRPRCSRASARGVTTRSRTGSSPRSAISSGAMPYADDPFSLVIFGASGDLTYRKLVPALWSLYAARTLPEPFAIIGTARSEMSDEAFRGRMREGVTRFARLKIPSQHVWDRFSASLFYVAGDPKATEDANAPELYIRLKQRLEQIETARGGPRNRLFYCATPPSLYDDIVAGIGSAGLARVDGGWTRIIVEKPFGRDLESARALNRQLTSVFQEEQVYRIDHY